MQTKRAFRRVPRGHASVHVSHFSSAAAGLRLQGLLPGDDLGREMPELSMGANVMNSRQSSHFAGSAHPGTPVRISRLTETNLAIADPGEDVLNKVVVSREGDECGVVADLVIATAPPQVLFIEVILTGQRSPGPVRVLVPAEAVMRVTEEHVYIEQSGDRVRHAPPCDLAEAFERWREQLYGHFGYPCFPPGATENGNGEQYGDVPYWSASARFSPHLCPPDEHHF
jgi:PRC-barrel domain